MYSEKDGGIVSFIAPHGEISVTPCEISNPQAVSEELESQSFESSTASLKTTSLEQAGAKAESTPQALTAALVEEKSKNELCLIPKRAALALRLR